MGLTHHFIMLVLSHLKMNDIYKPYRILNNVEVYA